MSAEKNDFEGLQSPLLEETDYDPSKFKKKSLDDIQAPVLEDTTYDSSADKKHSLEGVEAAVLEETQKKPSARDLYYSSSAPAQKSEKSALLEKEVSAPQLDDEPAPAPPPVSRFVDPEIERAKAEGKKLAAKGMPAPDLTEEEKQHQRELSRQLAAARDMSMAQKGSKLVIICMVLGIISTVCLSLFMKLDFQEGSKEIFDKISGGIIYYSIVIAVFSIVAIIRSQAVRKLCSAVFGLNTILMLFPGSTMITSKVDTTTGIILYAVSLILSGYVCITISSNENVEKYYKRRGDYYDF